MAEGQTDKARLTSRRAFLAASSLAKALSLSSLVFSPSALRTSVVICMPSCFLQTCSIQRVQHKVCQTDSQQQVQVTHEHKAGPAAGKHAARQRNSALCQMTNKKEMLFRQIVMSTQQKRHEQPTDTHMCELSPAEVCSLTCHFTCLCNQAFHVQPHSLIQIRMQTWMHALDVVLLQSLLHLQSTCNKTLQKTPCMAQHMATDTFKFDGLCQMPRSCPCLRACTSVRL